MMPEDRAFRIVHRALFEQMSFDEFEALVTSHTHPEVNELIAFAAQEIRDAIEPYRERIEDMRGQMDGLLFEREEMSFEYDIPIRGG